MEVPSTVWKFTDVLSAVPPVFVTVKTYEVVPELQAGLKAYFPFYNDERPHQSLDYRTPATVYREERVAGKSAG